MALSIITTFSDPAWHQTTTLEGSLFNLEFDYNQRGACWYLSIADADGVDIYNGVKLVVGFPLLRKCKDPRRPGWQAATGYGGDFVVVASSNDQTPPGQYDLLPGSGRCQLLYISSDWMQLLLTGQLATILAFYQAGGTTTSPVSTYGQQ